MTKPDGGLLIAARDLTADHPPRFLLHNLRLTRDGDTCWVEAANGDPLDSDSASLTYSQFTGFTTDSRPLMAWGTRAYLETIDAVLKVVTA